MNTLRFILTDKLISGKLPKPFKLAKAVRLIIPNKLADDPKSYHINSFDAFRKTYFEPQRLPAAAPTNFTGLTHSIWL